MKRASLVALTVIIGLSLSLQTAWAQAPKPPSEEKKVVLVQGSQAWTNTGIRLRAGDKVSISASGQVCFSGGAKDSAVGPTGWPVANYKQAWPNDWISCDDPAPGENHAGLLAEVGGQTFFVGSKISFTGKTGSLMLGINDCTFTGEYHNTGKYSVVITVRRPQPSGH